MCWAGAELGCAGRDGRLLDGTPYTPLAGRGRPTTGLVCGCGLGEGEGAFWWEAVRRKKLLIDREGDVCAGDESVRGGSCEEDPGVFVIVGCCAWGKGAYRLSGGGWLA